MVCMEEVFLPYMLAGDRTVYDALVSQQFRALSSIGSSAIALPGPTDNLYAERDSHQGHLVD